MSKAQFNITSESLSATKLSTKVRNFTLNVDEPESLGGTDEAPNPVEYLLVALAGCLNVVAHTVAKDLNISIQNLKIAVGGEIDINRFLGASDAERAGYQAIKVELSYDSEASKEELKEWLRQVNERCPVKDNLLNITPVILQVKSNRKAA